MDLDYKREVTVGLIVILGAVAFILGTMWLTGKSFRSGNVVTARFEDVTGLKVGSPVQIAGVQVGKVSGIDFGPGGTVDVHMNLDDEIKPSTDASALLKAIGLVGDMVIAFNPGRSGKPLPKDSVITGGFELGVMAKGGKLADRADSVLMGAQAIINQRTADQFYATLKQLQATLGATQKLMVAYGDPTKGPAGELTATAKQFRVLGARLDSTLANPAFTRTLQRSDTLTQHLTAMTKQFTATGEKLDSVLASVQRGEGSIGKFAKDTGFYNNTTRLMQSLDSLVRDLQKHPGKIGVTVKMF